MSSKPAAAFTFFFFLPLNNFETAFYFQNIVHILKRWKYFEYDVQHWYIQGAPFYINSFICVLSKIK